MKKPLRGINLGGWLVLEKWITPSLFAGTSAGDEWSLGQQLGHDRMAELLTQHRSAFITEADIEWIAKHGFDAVRLPVGYWVFDDQDGFYANIEYVDKLFEWANKYEIKVILDLHALPGSQNGWDHSGRAGVIGWHTDNENIIKTLVILRRLATRYRNYANLYGIEVINEPHTDIPIHLLTEYYLEAYKAVRELCDGSVRVIVSDSFRNTAMRRALIAAGLNDVVLDCHLYQVFTDEDRKLSFEKRLKRIEQWRQEITRTTQAIPVIIGEWSAALDPVAMSGLSERDREALYLAYYTAQREMYEVNAIAWFYWTYKTEDKGQWSYKNQPLFHQNPIT